MIRRWACIVEASAGGSWWKTRLAAELVEQRACAIYAAFLSDLAARFGRTGTQRFLCFTPDDRDARRYFEKLAGTEYKLWGANRMAISGLACKRFFDEHLRVRPTMAWS